jgi:hypothetical protein
MEMRFPPASRGSGPQRSRCSGNSLFVGYGPPSSQMPRRPSTRRSHARNDISRLIIGLPKLLRAGC